MNRGTATTNNKRRGIRSGAPISELTTQSDAPTPLVSIVVVNYNGEKYVERCISSILSQTYKNLEIIFVDNNSKDNSVEIIKKYPQIKLIESKENLYFAGGNNLGFKNSTGDIIYLLNNDAYPESNVIEKIVEVFNKNHKAGVVQNKLIYASDPNRIDSVGSMFTMLGFLKHLEIDPNKQSEIFSAKGASMAVRREIAEKSGLFHDSYKMYFEDTDLCWRAILMGFEVIYLPEFLTLHEVGKSTNYDTLPLTDYHSFKNRINSIITNSSFLLLLIVLPVHIAVCIFVILTYVPRDFRISKAIFRAILWNFTNLIPTLKLRYKVQSLRKQSDFYILKNLTIFPTPLYFFNLLRKYFDRKK